MKDGISYLSIKGWHKGSLKECETQELPEGLVLANDVSREW